MAYGTSSMCKAITIGNSIYKRINSDVKFIIFKNKHFAILIRL